MADSSARLMSFVTQEQAEEIKKKRQEEWERVRKPSDPLEQPAEVYDARPLYERLKEQKDKAQETHDEQFKFKNMIYKGLDDDEASFLNVVVNHHDLQIKNLVNREKEELSAYRGAVSQLLDELEHNVDNETTVVTMDHPTPPKSIQSKSQSSLLAGTIITKRKRKSSSTGNNQEVETEKKRKKDDHTESVNTSTTTATDTQHSLPTKTPSSIIVKQGLSSLAQYSSTSSSDDDSHD